MLILYAYDTNAIFVESTKTRSDTDMFYAYYVLYYTLKNAGHAPKLNIMDNEAPSALKILFQKGITVGQLAPPQIQRRKTEERAIHTFKNHFVAGLASVDKKIIFIYGVEY